MHCIVAYLCLLLTRLIDGAVWVQFFAWNIETTTFCVKNKKECYIVSQTLNILLRFSIQKVTLQNVLTKSPTKSNTLMPNC